MNARILLASVALFVLLSGCVDSLQPPAGPPADAKDCGSDLQCFKDSAAAGEKAFVLVEQPDSGGVVMSHTVTACSNGLCIVAIRIEDFGEEAPPILVTMMEDSRDMQCSVPIEMLGELPDSIDLCSGPLVDFTKSLVETNEG